MLRKFCTTEVQSRVCHGPEQSMYCRWWGERVLAVLILLWTVPTSSHQLWYYYILYIHITYYVLCIMKLEIKWKHTASKILVWSTGTSAVRKILIRTSHKVLWTTSRSLQAAGSWRLHGADVDPVPISILGGHLDEKIVGMLIKPALA